MTPTLTQTELNAVNQGRFERGLPPLRSFARGVQANAALGAVAQDFAPQSSNFAQNVRAAIARQLGHRAYTKPTEPEGEPSTFAEQLAAATRKRRRGYLRPTKTTK
jgi:hypothetical protein